MPKNLRWLNIYDIALDLEENFPDRDIMTLSFPILQKLILSLPNFDDDIANCNEKVLEAIQQAWLEERG